MTPAGVNERLQATRAEVDQACELLVRPSPESLDRCTKILEAAGRRLAETQRGLLDRVFREGIEGERARTEAYRLRESVERASRLLEGASSFHLNWNRLRGAMTFGYTHSGDAAAAPGVSRIMIRG